MNPRRRWLLSTLLMLGLTASLAAQKRETQLRTVSGQVLSKSEDPVASGVVYLKNLKSQTVKTYISDDNGQYRFSGLDPNSDYEIHAEKEGTASAKRRISSLDSRKEIVINLKLDKSRE
jgi:hypothetical protein